MKSKPSFTLTIDYSKKSISPDYIRPSYFANALFPISLDAIKYIDDHSFFCKIPKGKIFLKQGNICPYVFIVNKGVARGFIKNGKKEITTWITAENEMVTSISSFFSQTPAIENIQALEDCELTGLSFDILENIYKRFPEMNIVTRKLLEKYYCDAEDRAFVGRLPKAVDKYKHFLKTKPQLINRIPLKFVASFLGITMETLSRLRTNLSKTQ